MAIHRDWRFQALKLTGYLRRGSWDLVSQVTNKVTILITPVKVLRTLLTKSHGPPSIP